MKKNKMNSVIFLTAFGVLALGSICYPKTVFSSSENRYLAQKPKFTWSGLLNGTYGTAYETYLSDQFPLRDSWVSVKTKLEQLMLKEDINGVYIGRDGYLIEKFDREDIETEQMETNLQILASFADHMMEKLGEEQVRLMLVPSAASVIEEKLPAFSAPYDQTQIHTYMTSMPKDAYGLRESLMDTEVLVPVADVLREHQDEALYYRTDHHWTALGAYYGYQAYADSVGIEPWKQEQFDVEIVSRDFFGTIASKVQMDREPDTIEIYHPVVEQKYEVYYDGQREAFYSLYNLENLKGKDKYTVYLDGNHGLTEIRNMTLHEQNENGQQRKLLMLKDSFAHSVAPFIANHFETTYMIDLRYYQGNIDQFVEEHGVTDVLVIYQIPGLATEKNLWKLSR